MACHQFHAKDMDWWKKESFSKYQMHLVGLCMSSTFSPSKNPKKTVLCHHFHRISWSNHLPILTLPFFFVTRYSSTKAEFKGQSADTSEVSLGGRSFFGWMKNPHGAMEMFFGLESLGGGFLGRFGPCGVFGCEAKLFWGLQKLTTKFSGDVFFCFFCAASDSPANLFLVNRDWHQERLLKKLQREILMNPVGFPKPAPLETRRRGFSARGERFVNSH